MPIAGPPTQMQLEDEPSNAKNPGIASSSTNHRHTRVVFEVRAAAALARRANSHAPSGTQTVHAVAAQNRAQAACRHARTHAVGGTEGRRSPLHPCGPQGRRSAARRPERKCADWARLRVAVARAAAPTHRTARPTAASPAAAHCARGRRALGARARLHLRERLGRLDLDHSQVLAAVRLGNLRQLSKASTVLSPSHITHRHTRARARTHARTHTSSSHIPHARTHMHARAHALVYAQTHGNANAHAAGKGKRRQQGRVLRMIIRRTRLEPDGVTFLP
jgi:hypothetical protein